MKKQIFLGVDCGSEHLWCYAMKENEEEIWNHSIPNVHEGYTCLLDQVHSWQKGGATVWVAGEGTGGYMSPLDKYLQEAGCLHVNVSSKELRRYREMMGYPLDKDDERDARHLAEVLQWRVEKNRVHPIPKQDEYYAALKENARAHEQLTKLKTETQNILVTAVRRYWPELVASGYFFARTDATGLLALLIAYPTPTLMAEAGREQIEAVLRKATGQPQPQLSERLFSQACELKSRASVSSTSVKNIQSLAESLRRVIINLRELEKEMEAQVKTHPLGQWMLTLEGLGVRTVACFLGEAGDLSRFENEAKLSRYAGTGGVKDQSGKSKDRHQDCRCYNHHLKRAIMLIAQSRYMNHEESRQYVLSRKQKKEEHWDIIKKLARYIIRRLWKKWEELVDNQGINSTSTA